MAFSVKILKTKLVVYKSNKKVYETPYKQVYMPGSSILARIDDSGKHVYVGHDILEFDVYEFIEGFYSQTSRPDELRAYIVTKDHVYVINDDRFYPRSIFPSLLDVVKPSKSLKAKMKKMGISMDSKRIVV